MEYSEEERELLEAYRHAEPVDVVRPSGGVRVVSSLSPDTAPPPPPE